MLAAERLYAERGLDKVSLREIAAAAGQANNAAVHYHFGGREGLVRAVFEHRFAVLDRRRREMLAALDAAGKGHDIRELVAVLVLPFAEGLDGSGGHWVRFVARLHEDPRYNPFADPRSSRNRPYTASEESTIATRETSERIRAAAGLREPALSLRMFLVTTFVVHAVADREALIAAGAGRALRSNHRFRRELVDVATAMITVRTQG